MSLIDKYKQNGFLADGDILVQGTFALSGKDVGKGVFKSMLLMVVTLGMLYSVPTAKTFVMSANDKRLNMIVDGKASVIEKEQIAGIEILKESKKALTLEIKFKEGQPIKLVARAYKNQSTIEQIKTIFQTYQIAK